MGAADSAGRGHKSPKFGAASVNPRMSGPDSSVGVGRIVKGSLGCIVG